MFPDTAKAFAKNTPSSKNMAFDPLRVERLLTVTLLPSVGLHLSLLATLVFFEEDWQAFGQALPVFVLATFATLTYALFSREPQTELTASRTANALFGFAVSMVISAMAYNDLLIQAEQHVIIFAGVMISLYILVCWACMRDSLQPLSLAVIGGYTALFFDVYAVGATFEITVVLLIVCFTFGGIVLARKSKLQYMFAFVVAGTAIALIGFEADSSGILLLVFATLVALLIFQVSTTKDTMSDWVSFFAQGFGVFLLGFGSLMVIGGPSFFGPIVTGYAILTGLAAAFRKGTSLVPNAVWLLILGCASIFESQGNILNAGDRLLFASVVCAGLLLLGQMAQNLFARTCAAIAAVAAAAATIIFVNDEVAGLVARSTQSAADNNTSTVTFHPSVLQPTAMLSAATLLMVWLVAVLRLPKRGLAWWRGLIPQRYMVVLRNIFRTAESKLSNLPVVGWIWALGKAAYTWLRHLKTNGERVTVFDALEIMAFGCASAVCYELAKTGLDLFERHITVPGNFGIHPSILFVLCWVGWGIILCLRGRLHGSTFHVIAGLCFILLPALNTFFDLSLVAGPAASNNWYWPFTIMLSCLAVFLLSLVSLTKTAP